MSKFSGMCFSSSDKMSAKIFCRVISTSSSIWFVDGSDVIETFVDKFELFFGISSRFGAFVGINIFVMRPFFGMKDVVDISKFVEINDKFVGKGGNIFDIIEFLDEFV